MDITISKEPRTVGDFINIGVTFPSGVTREVSVPKASFTGTANEKKAAVKAAIIQYYNYHKTELQEPSASGLINQVISVPEIDT